MNILIMGYGNIGHHIENELKSNNINISIYDKYKEPWNDEKQLNQYYDVAFIAVPTEKLPDGHCDTSEVYDAVSKINADAIVIKSAVPCGTCDKLAANVLVSPEYYGTTQHSLEAPNFLILGGCKKAAAKVVELYSLVKDGSYHFMFVDRRTAELAKYMENCWIATKVTFCSEFYKIAEKFGIPYPELRECFLADERVSPSHTYVYSDHPYYDSHCLNKDIPGLIKQCEDNGFNATFMKAVDAENKRSKMNQKK